MYNEHMGECYSKVFIENGQLRDRGDFELSKVFEDHVIYEVIRVRRGIPVFLEDHYNRLEKSASLGGNQLLTAYRELRKQIMRLIGLSDIKNGNIKVTVKYSPSYTGYLIYFVDARYPGPLMYKNGVRGILYFAERRNPVAKVFNHKLRSSIYSELIQTGAYEALLVNRKGCITEGSRSNLFFIISGKIITAPDDCVLGGITRAKILKICEEEGFTVEYRCLHAGELGNTDSAFLTGTSPNVLPFRKIEVYDFDIDNKMLKMLTHKYMQVVEDYIRKFSPQEK